ncbi:MAG: branched-chain amino acid ABC transporter permease [Chloroflexi bacterium]|nr:branched-chain amino acid ABC transporter permease [Chloroflexota bacterium]
MADQEIFGQSLVNVIQFTISGLLTGGLYTLVALGIVVINKASGVFNFAHGWMMFIGGLLFWQFYQNPPSDQMVFSVGFLAAVFILSVIGMMGMSPRIIWQRFFASDDKQGEAKSLESSRESKEGDVSFFHQNRTIITLVVGTILWLVMIYLFIQDSEPILRGVIGALVGTTLIGLLIERFTIRPLLGQPLLTAILMTLAVGFMLQGTIQIIWGEQARGIDIFREPPTINSIPLPDGSYMVVGTTPGGTLPAYPIRTKSWLGRDILLERSLTWGFGISVLAFGTFVILFQFTSLGLALRATAENQVLAQSVGLRVRLLLAVAWAMVAVMAGIAGSIQGTASALSAETVPFIALLVFPAVLLGGLESVTGALVGGLIIGIVQKLSALYISDKASIEMAPYVVLMIVLLFRPEGLFGQQRIDRV